MSDNDVSWLTAYIQWQWQAGHAHSHCLILMMLWTTETDYNSTSHTRQYGIGPW